MTREGVPSVLKRSTLDTIGYICEEIPPEVLTSAADQILTAIIHGMRPQESDEQVKLCACKALFLALAFCQKNFENRTECAIIMESVLNAMIVSNDDIRVSAYAILTEIATLHYSVLPPFMQQIFKLTMTAITETDEEDITKSAIEFWCTIADEELNLLEEIEYTKEKGGQVPHCENFIKGALPFLVPLLNKCLVLQKKDSDPDEWTIPMAAGVCLSLVAQTVKDEVVQYVLPFVEANITSQDWKCREAAVLAFGSILEGPVNVIQKLISQAIGVLLTHLKDPITAVKDTTAWTLGSILKLHPRAVVSAAEGILKGLCESLGDPKPRVASHACFAIHNLAASYEGDPANPLQRHFVEVVRMLLLCADRHDSDEHHLRTAAYEALNVVLSTAPPNADEALVQITSAMIERLEKTFSIECLSQDDLNRQNQLQGLLCGTLQILAQRMDTNIVPFCDPIMIQVIKLFRSKNDSGVYEEGLLTVGAVANVVDIQFEKYMMDLAPHLLNALQNSAEYQVCCVAVGLVGDISRALGLKLLPYCDQIITILLRNLQSKDLERSVKPPILSAFGDIALAIGGYFDKYLEVVMYMLMQAAETVMKTHIKVDDFDNLDYINQLREGICEAYTGIIQGLRTDKKVDKIQNNVEVIIRFISHIAQDQNRTEAVTRDAVGIIGDLATSFRHLPNFRPGFTQSFILKLVEDCEACESKESKETAQWAKSVIGSL
eukprot:TRINITY_DN3649_c0_g2_i6.p1 TRINITY_DN3649_c0_g2~~TRINITY_DN3649_c0_g2_i6.p1  ORF type:complete len:720 (-),score=104.18 TRINITY_DN3649_c0_g2_i6:126-2285(-)